jgi:hypothetical protein
MEERVCNEFEMIQLRVHSPCTLLFPNRLRDSVCHLTAETNVGQVFLRSGQLSVVNLDPDTLVDLFSIIVNKLVYKTSVKDIMDTEYYRGL